MTVHEFVSSSKPIMVLVHGALTPWQVWMPQINSFRSQYNIYAIALSAHTEEAASEFISVSNEAEEIVKYFAQNGIDTIDVLCGFSLGGKIVHEIWKSCKLTIKNLIMDGAPLTACPTFAVNIMIRNYKNIIHKSKKRDAKVAKTFKEHFLPEKYFDSYLKIADFMTDESIENMVTSVFAGGEIKNLNNQTRILFLHGTKANEVLSQKSAKLMQEYCPATQVVCFKGDAHCYKLIYQPEKWTEIVNNFLQNQ